MSRSPRRKKDGSPPKKQGVSCPICGRPGYKNGKSVAVHIARVHKDARDDTNLLQKVRKITSQGRQKKCPHCKKMRTNLGRHLKACPRRPDLVLRPGQEREPGGDPPIDNEEFLRQYRERLEMPGIGIRRSTARDYTGYVRRMIADEINGDPEFLASNWLADPRSPRFRPLRNTTHYIRSTYGDASVTSLSAAYKLLWSWIKEKMMDFEDSPLTRHEKLLGSLARAQKMAKKGRFSQKNKPKAANFQKPGDWLDPALTERILDDYFESPRRRAYLEEIEEDGLERGQAELFLALETYLRGNGIRLDAVRNITVSDIMSATPTYTQCPFCQEMVIWRDHSAVCVDRQEALDRGEDDHVVGNSTDWRFEVHHHKTGNVGHVELVWSDIFMKMVRSWISKLGLKQTDAPFENAAKWPKVKRLIWKIVNKQLLEKTRGRLRAYDFRRLAIKKIFDSGTDLGESNFQFKTSLH